MLGMVCRGGKVLEGAWRVVRHSSRSTKRWANVSGGASSPCLSSIRGTFSVETPTIILASSPYNKDPTFSGTVLGSSQLLQLRSNAFGGGGGGKGGGPLEVAAEKALEPLEPQSLQKKP